MPESQDNVVLFPRRYRLPGVRGKPCPLGAYSTLRTAQLFRFITQVECMHPVIDDAEQRQLVCRKARLILAELQVLHDIAISYMDSGEI